MSTRVTWLAVTPANSIWRWVPSPGSNSRPSPSQRRKYPLWLRVLVGAWLAVPRTISSRFATGPGARERVVAVGELPVALDVRPVPVVLPVLREQDQRRRVRGLGGEGEVEQDERIRVPVVEGGDRVEDDPADHQQRLAEQEPAGAEEPRDRLRKPPERVRVVPGAHRRRAAGHRQVAAVAEAARAEPCHRVSVPPARQSAGSSRSSTSSTVTAPSSRPSESHTATPIRLYAASRAARSRSGISGRTNSRASTHSPIDVDGARRSSRWKPTLPRYRPVGVIAGGSQT